jgi:hypothetical protein
MLVVAPITIKAAALYIRQHHRHHIPPRGGFFAVSVCAKETVSVGRFSARRIHGVAVVGRPVARMLQDGWTAEVTRVATDGSPNCCSKLYAACWRAMRAIGYRRGVTYTLASEPGTSLRAAGWTPVAKVKGASWDRARRRRTDKHPTVDKIRWEVKV